MVGIFDIFGGYSADYIWVESKTPFQGCSAFPDHEPVGLYFVDCKIRARNPQALSSISLFSFVLSLYLCRVHG